VLSSISSDTLSSSTEDYNSTSSYTTIFIIIMRFSTVFNGMAIVSVAVANPIPPQPIPGVNITAVDPSDAAQVITTSWIIQYKSGVSGQDVDNHQKEIKAKLGKDPKAKFSVPGFEAVHVETDDAGIAKIGKHPSVRPLPNLASVFTTKQKMLIQNCRSSISSATWSFNSLQ
jgi:hypothetical protein